MLRCIALAGLLLGSAALADSWMPFGERLWVSENARYYVVISAVRSDCELRFFEQRKGRHLPYVRPIDWRKDEIVVDAKLDPIHRWTLSQLPIDAWVLSDTPRVLLFDQYAGIGYGTTLALRSASGKTIWKHKLGDFRFRQDRFMRTTNSIIWRMGWWVDETRGKVIVVARGGQFREVDLETGDIADASATIVQHALRKGSSAVRCAALALCGIGRDDIALRGWVPIALVIRDDEDRPMLERFTAARVLQYGAKRPAPIELYRAALKHLDDRAIRQAVLDDAPGLFKNEAAPLLAAILKADPKWRTYECVIDLSFLGPGGLAVIERFASDKTVPRKARLDALQALLNNNVEGSHAVFARCVRAADEEFAREAIRDMRGRSQDDMPGAMAAALAKQGSGDRAVARYLADYPDRRFVAALEAARGRANTDPETRKVIDAALGRCRTAK